MPQEEKGYAFRVLEVHTLHVRDFGGERLIQALGEIGDYEVSVARARSELRAALFPAREITRKGLPFLLILIVGAALCLTPQGLELKYNLLPAISRQAFEVIHHRKI